MFTFHVPVHNLEMLHTNEVKHDRLIITRLRDHDTIIFNIRTYREYRPTAIATINVPDNIQVAADANEYVKNYIVPYQRLLSFAQDHDVRFVGSSWGKPIEQIEQEIKQVPSIGKITKWNSSVIVYSEVLNEFLDIAIPLLTNENYNAKTGLQRALIHYNTGYFLDAIETQLAMYFVGLETITNAYWDNLIESETLSKTWLFEKETWSVLQKSVRQKVDELKIEDPSRGKFLNRFGNLKDPPIEEKIKALCNAYNLPDYSKEIALINEMRNDFLHDRKIENTYGNLQYYEVVFCCQRLLAKMILKLLNFYHKHPKVHGAYTNDNLLAED